MISGMRDQVLALLCVRHDVAAVQGRGLHLLPPESVAALTDGLVGSLDVGELRRALEHTGC